MATQKVTITLDETDLSRIRGLVQAGQAASVSGFVQHAVRLSLDDVSGWADALAQGLEATGGSLTDDEREWADRILTGGPTRAGTAV